LLRDV